MRIITHRKTALVSSGLKLEWTSKPITQFNQPEENRVAILPLPNIPGYNFTVNWGDGSPINTVTSYNSANARHTYSQAGTYVIEIKGECPGLVSMYPFDNWQYNITDIINWGTPDVFGGFSRLSFSNVVHLKSTGYGSILAKPSLTSLSDCFSRCYDLSVVRPNLFDNCTNVISIYGIFLNSSNLTSIPPSLFDKMINLTDASYAFWLGGLTQIPADLFKYCTQIGVGGGYAGFMGCFGSTKITSIPADLFRYNTSVVERAFNSTFESCTLLEHIPADLFRYNTLAGNHGFNSTFYNCTSLLDVPEYLFRYNNPGQYGFHFTFYNCKKLKLNKYIFYAEGEQSTRFAGKTVALSGTFYRDTFTGEQGEAPDLWNCTFGSVSKSQCFYGAGNSLASISNYASIPADWK